MKLTRIALKTYDGANKTEYTFKDEDNKIVTITCKNPTAFRAGEVIELEVTNKKVDGAVMRGKSPEEAE